MHRHLAKVSFVNGLHNTLQYSSSSALSETRLTYLLVTESTFQMKARYPIRAAREYVAYCRLYVRHSSM